MADPERVNIGSAFRIVLPPQAHAQRDPLGGSGIGPAMVMHRRLVHAGFHECRGCEERARRIDLVVAWARGRIGF